MSKQGLAIVCLVGITLGCSPDGSNHSGSPSLRQASVQRVFYTGKLEEHELPVSIVPRPGWTKRESNLMLSLIHTNGNVINIGPAYGPITDDHDPLEESKGWLDVGQKQGSDIWDVRHFNANGRPGSYVIHIGSNSKSYQSPAGELTGTIGGNVMLGFHGYFHPGDTDLNEITKILETVTVESK